MIEVQHAEFRRATMKDGRYCGEVEALTSDERMPKVLVYLAVSEVTDYDMVAVVANDASTEIDWYDNPLHQAFANRADAFASEAAGADWSERESFKEQVLSFGSVREDLARELVD